MRNWRMQHLGLGVLTLLSLCPSVLAVDVPSDAKPILANTTPWRWHVAWRRPYLSMEALKAAGRPSSQPALVKPGLSFGDIADTEKLETPPPPADWTSPDFDDFDWPRGPAPVAMTGGHMGNPHISVGLLSVRGKFVVEDPKAVTGLFLSLGYRGGVVVYLNGREVARCDLPVGEVPSATPGSPYPDEAWVDADGKALPRPSDMKPEHKQRAGKRDRKLGPVQLPADQLRKGLNVLAIEAHRSDFHPIANTWWATDRFRYGYYVGWTPLALNDVTLLATGTGFTPNVTRPAGLHVWALDVVDRLDGVDIPDPAAQAAPPPIVIAAARNGQFSGALAVTSTQPIKGVKVTPGDLAQTSGGGKIPASAVRVRYISKAKLPADAPNAPVGFDLFSDTPPAEVAVDKRGCASLPIWLAVRVPKDAAAGRYEGKAIVQVEGAEPVEMTVRMTVADWTLPDPQGFRTVVNLYQSPTTLSLHYRVPEWSEEHWKLMEKSFELLAPFGVDLVNIPISDQTQFGNDDGMVYWIKKAAGGYDYDFTVFDRYLKLVKKHLGTPPFVSLHVWHMGGYESPTAAKQKNTVTVIDPATRAREHLQVPEFGTEESKKFWTPALNAIKDRLAKEGLERSMCLGILSDGVGPAAMHKMFAEILPGVSWTRGCHYGTYDTKPTALPGGGKIVCQEFCYGTGVQDPGRMIPNLSDCPNRPGVSYFRGERDSLTLAYMRMTAQRALCGSTRGVGRVGLDFWSLKWQTSGRTTYANIYNRWPHSSCAQREPTVWGLAQPGPDGALWTVRLQTLLEGVQEAEALAFIVQATERSADKLGPELAGRCRTFFVDTIQNCRQSQYAPRNHAGWHARSARLYALAAEAAGAIAAGR